MQTWLQQRAAEPEWFAADGERLGEVFFRRAGEEFVDAGPRAYFDAIDRLEVGFQTEDDPPGAPRAAGPDAAQMSSIDYVRRIVEFCRANGIALWIFITPAHVHQAEIAAATGSVDSIERGKRELARLLAEDAARHPRAPPIVAWDFSGYSSVTEEPPPPPGSHQEMRNYWDSSHFKSVVGDYVLDRLFDQPDDSGPPADFGSRIDAATIDRALAIERQRQASYRARHPEDTAHLTSLVRSALASRGTARPGG